MTVYVVHYHYVRVRLKKTCFSHFLGGASWRRPQKLCHLRCKLLPKIGANLASPIPKGSLREKLWPPAPPEKWEPIMWKSRKNSRKNNTCRDKYVLWNPTVRYIGQISQRPSVRRNLPHIFSLSCALASCLSHNWTKPCPNNTLRDMLNSPMVKYYRVEKWLSFSMSLCGVRCKGGHPVFVRCPIRRAVSSFPHLLNSTANSFGERWREKDR